MESPFCGPHISAHALPLDGELAFYLKKIYFLEKDLESQLTFVLFLKGKQIKKKTLSVTPYLEKMACEKPNLGSGVRLLIGNV